MSRDSLATCEKCGLGRRRIASIELLSPAWRHAPAFNEVYMPSKELRDSLHAIFGDVAPKLVDLTEKLVFDDIWERKALSKRDRSLVTVAALIAMNRPEQLPAHLGRALDNGVKRKELEEVITHLAIYSGFPNAITAARLAHEVFEKRGAKRQSKKK